MTLKSAINHDLEVLVGCVCGEPGQERRGNQGRNRMLADCFLVENDLASANKRWYKVHDDLNGIEDLKVERARARMLNLTLLWT